MPEDLPPDERYELGVRLGRIVWQIFELIAKADGVDVHEAVQEWIAAYVAEQITAPGSDL